MKCFTILIQKVKEQETFASVCLMVIGFVAVAFLNTVNAASPSFDTILAGEITKKELLEFDIIPVNDFPNEVDPDVIDTIYLAGGQIVEFIDEFGSVSVVEVGPLSSPRVIAQLAAEDRVTPLEIYQRLTEDRPPVEIIDDHYRAVAKMEREKTTPKRLNFDIAIRPVTFFKGELEETIDCNYNQAFIGNSMWAQNWFFENGGADQRAQETYEYFEMQPGNKYVWTGGNSSRRWLGACNGDRLSTPSPSFTFFPEFQNQNGDWTWNWNKQIDPWHKVTYLSSSLGHKKWRIALQVYSVGLIKTLGVGVAIIDALPPIFKANTSNSSAHGISVPLPPPSVTAVIQKKRRRN